MRPSQVVKKLSFLLLGSKNFIFNLKTLKKHLKNFNKSISSLKSELNR
jgi:hypothetical protein